MRPLFVRIATATGRWDRNGTELIGDLCSQVKAHPPCRLDSPPLALSPAGYTLFCVIKIHARGAGGGKKAFRLYLLGGPVSCVFFRGSLHHHPMLRLLLLLLLLAYSSSSFYLFKRRNYIPSSSSAAAYLVGSSCTYEYDRNVNIIRCTREE